MYYGVLKIGLCIGFFLIMSYLVSFFSWLSTVLDFLGFSLASLILSWHLSIFLKDLYSRRGTHVNPKGKCVFVTGCDTGFGHDIALTLNKTGFTVFAGCLFKDRSEAQSLLEKCSEPKRMFLVSLNITKQEDIEAAARIINKHTESTGEVFYSLVNNAGISGFSPLEWGSFKEDVQPVIDVNLKATVKVTESMIPLLRKNHDSRIINMTSYVTHIAMPFISTYCVSKCGLRAFSEVLRRDMESNTEYFNGMKVITIEPTAYKTGIVGYDNIKSTLRRTWNRSDPEVKDSYGVSIFDGMVAFVAVCEFFRFFDFVALKRNVHEVSEYVREALLHTHPNVDVKILTKSIEVGSNIWFHFIPQDIQELYFMLLAWTGYIFVVEVAFIKKFLRTNVN